MRLGHAMRLGHVEREVGHVEHPGFMLHPQFMLESNPISLAHVSFRRVYPCTPCSTTGLASGHGVQGT